MKNNAVLGHAIIKEVKFRYKDAGILFVYTFNCNGEEITNTSLFDCDYSKIKDLRSYFVNRELPMIYVSNSCSSSRILFDEKIAREYDLDGQLSAADGESIRILDSIKIH